MARTSLLARRISSWFGCAGFVPRPVMPAAKAPGSVSEIQAGLLLSPLRMGLLRPVSPRTLELLRAARLITEREYVIVASQLLPR